MKWMIFLALALVTMPAWAQQPSETDKALSGMVSDWNAMQNAQGHVASAMQIVTKALQDAQAKVKELQAEIDKLKAEQKK